jgi:hypothetical protein
MYRQKPSSSSSNSTHPPAAQRLADGALKGGLPAEVDEGQGEGMANKPRMAQAVQCLRGLL